MILSLDPKLLPPHNTYWKASNEKLLLVQKCSKCGICQWYPRAICIHCGSLAIEWQRSSGIGILHSYTKPRDLEQNPEKSRFVIGLVELQDEHVRIYSLVRIDRVSELHIGMRLRLDPKGERFPLFVPDL